MSEMNTPKDSRTGLSEKLDGILSKDPTNALASALKEALPDLSASQAEQILNRLNKEMPTSKVEGGAGSEATGAPLSPQVERWIKTLKENPDRQFRAEAASNLGERKDPRAVPQLIGALKDEDSRVRNWAAKALGSIEDPRAVPALCSALKYWDGDAKIWLVEMLGKIKDPRAVEPLAVLRDGNSGVRYEAALALGKIKDPRAVPALCEALKDDYWEVRRAAAWALGEIGDGSAIKPLKARLDGFLGILGGEKDEYVRAEIEAAIQKLEGK